MTQLTVDTLSGPIRGRRKEDVYLFSGIPYAAAPIDDLRFKPPQPHRPWTEVRDALKFGPAAPQTPGGGLTANAPVRWHEDCLTLNVSTPACDQERRAVLVWIHGGHYRTGQGAIPWYNGHSFNLNGDIVVVSINYRLGALGFTDLSHLGADYASSGYNGLLDQIAALRWVQDNISQFGGDPNKVTIAGESAGAFSVSTLLGCEQAQGLFRGAIAQSGAAHHTLEKAAAEKTAERFLNELGVSDVLSLAAIDVQRILDAQAKTCGALEGGTGEINQLGGHVAPFYPHHGNDLLPRSPIDAIRAGCGSDVAVLLGSNSQETTMWGFGKVDKHKLVAVASSLNAKHAIDVYRTQSVRELTRKLCWWPSHQIICFAYRRYVLQRRAPNIPSKRGCICLTGNHVR